MKAGTKLAASEAMRMSHAQASERPAPAAAPLTAAITGFSSARIARSSGGSRAQALADVAGRLAELGQVLADAEAAPGAGEDDRAHLRIARLLERRASASCIARRTRSAPPAG